MDFTAIDKVGIELEGGWNRRPANATFHHDGSVTGLHGQATTIGEMVSAPMASWETVTEWMIDSYPVAHNASCGMHVHVSFKLRRDYARLMTPEFFEYFGNRMKAWGERVKLPASHLFWTRLNGFNGFCKKQFNADVQAAQRGKSGCRYTQLNYAFLFHGTIECRLFPVFKKANIAISAIQELCAIYEDWLRATPHVDPIEIVDGLA